MNTHSLCCIGYITQDKVVTPKNTIYMPGGTSFYFAHAIKHLNANDFLLVTALADTDMGIVEDIRKEGISVKALHSTHSVCFENIYGENQNERTQRVTAKADPFTVEGLKDTDARIIHLGSLLADDFSLEVIKFLSGKGLLSVDVQGFLRKVENEKVLAVDWPEKKEALKYIHILKANEAEMEVLTGCSEPHEAAMLIADWGVKEELLTLGEKGSLIYAQGEIHESGPSDNRCNGMRRHLYGGVSVYAQQRRIPPGSGMLCRRHVYHKTTITRAILRNGGSD